MAMDGNKGKAMIAKVVGIMFMSRTAAHLAHLRTKSYSTHKVLNSFYDDVVDAADEIAEVGQGVWGTLPIAYEPLDGDVNDPVCMLTKHLSRIEKIANECGNEALKGPLIDAIGLYRKTIYLLGLK